MSRSFKKFPLVVQEKQNYRYLNRQLRHDKLAKIPNGGFYRKHSIHDHEWSYMWAWEEAKKNYYEFNRQKKYTMEEWYQYWKKCVVRK